jgi:hypothetical protein
MASALALVACSKKPASQASSAPAGETASTAAAGAAAAAPGGGVFTPHRKAGLWQLAMDTSGGPGVQMKAQMCIDASTDKDFAWHGPHSSSQNCDKMQMHPTMGGFDFDSVCRTGGRTITSHGTVTGDFNSAYNLDVTTKMDPPGPGGMGGETKAQIKAKWLGPCPADMKPGAMKVGGMTIGGR